MTDHRIKLTLHRLDDILNGDLDEIIDSLTAADQAAKLSKLQEMEQMCIRDRMYSVLLETVVSA